MQSTDYNCTRGYTESKFVRKEHRFEEATNLFVHMQNKLPLCVEKLLELWAPQSHDIPTSIE